MNNSLCCTLYPACALSCSPCTLFTRLPRYRKNGSKRPPHGKRPGALFLAKTGKIRGERPLSRQKCWKRPGLTANVPPVICLGKRRAGNSFEYGRWSCFRSRQRRAFLRELHAWDVGWSCFTQQQNRQSQTRTQPLSQPGRRSTVSHEATVVAAEAGVVDHLELRRCRAGVPPLRPH